LADEVKEKCYEQNPDGTFSLSSDKLCQQRYYFFKDLCQPFIDSYLVVAMTINDMMQAGRVIEQSKFVTEIHIGVQEIFFKGGIKFMSSCLIQVLDSAVGRFA